MLGDLDSYDKADPPLGREFGYLNDCQEPQWQLLKERIKDLYPNYPRRQESIARFRDVVGHACFLHLGGRGKGTGA